MGQFGAVTAPLILDTCAVIWIAEDQPIGAEARDAIEQEIKSGAAVLVSPMTAWEIGLLTARGRITLSMGPLKWFERFSSMPGVALAPMTAGTLIESSYLPGRPPNDPVDRMMIATARELGGRLVTRDRALLSYGEAGHLMTLAC